MLIVIDTTVLVSAVQKPEGAAFRLLQALRASPLERAVISDVSGLEFIRTAHDLGYSPELISEFIRNLAPLFAADDILNSPVSRRFLGTKLDNLSLTDAAQHLVAIERGTFRADIPDAIRKAHESRDENDLHVIWAVTTIGADILCSADSGFGDEVAGARVLSPWTLFEERFL